MSEDEPTRLRRAVGAADALAALVRAWAQMPAHPGEHDEVYFAAVAVAEDAIIDALRQYDRARPIAPRVVSPCGGAPACGNRSIAPSSGESPDDARRPPSTVKGKGSMEPSAWIGKCDGCGLYCVLYEQVEFVCGKCHGAINPGTAISKEVATAITTLVAAGLPTTEILAALWGKRYADALQDLSPTERHALLMNQWLEENQANCINCGAVVLKDSVSYRREQVCGACYAVLPINRD